MRILGAIAIAALVAAAEVKQAKPKTKPKPYETISNYWLYLNDLLREEAKRPIPKRDPNVRIPPSRTYPFEALMELRPADLVRAARESIRDANDTMRGRPEEEIERKVEGNIHVCMEYFPLLVRKDDDAKQLWDIIESPQSEMAFRLFLLKRVVPGFAPTSGFSEYLQTAARRNPQSTLKLLSGVACSLSETIPPATAAIEAWYSFLHEDYIGLFQGDPQVAEYAKAHGGKASPMLIKRENGIVLSPEVAEALKPRSEEFAAMARKLAAHLDPANNRPMPIKKTVRNTLLRIATEIPLEDPAAIMEMLAADAPAPPPADAASAAQAPASGAKPVATPAPGTAS